MKNKDLQYLLTLEGKARETILNLDIQEIKAKNGVENIVKALNKLYLKDKLQMAYETYAFEKFRLKRWVLKNILMSLNVY